MVQYLVNCFWLIVPILLWNAIFANRLPKPFSPEVFDHVPLWITFGENFFRLFVFLLPLLMPLQLSGIQQKAGLALYGVGVLLYFLSWIPLLFFPESSWSTSLIGFLGPFYTPLIWAVGIGLIGRTLFIPISYHPWFYIIISTVFIVFHCRHGIIVYTKYF